MWLTVSREHRPSRQLLARSSSPIAAPGQQHQFTFPGGTGDVVALLSRSSRT
jgi:hypothetical protein